MAQAPKKAKKSPAQVKANQAFAAAGRAAQHRTRAAAIAKTGKPPPGSKAQKRARHASGVKWAAAGRAAQAARRAGKTPVSAKKAALPARLCYGDDPVLWLPGCNDEQPTCGSVAIANHLLAATGVIAPDEEILALYEAAGGGDGASLPTTLEAVSYRGLAGMKLAEFWRASPDMIVPGMIYGVQMRRGYHAVVAHPYGMVSWGMVLAWAGEPEEAWMLEWAQPEGEQWST